MNIYVKLALIVLCLGGGIVLWSLYGFWYASLFLIAGIVLLLSYILLGTVMSASQLMETGDFDAAEKRLKMTLKPSWLYSGTKANYKILEGSFASQKGDDKLAQSLFNEALEMDLRTDDEKGMVLLQLINIQAKKGNITGAKKYMQQVKKLNITFSQTKEQVDMMDKGLKQAEANRKATMGRGGKGGGMIQPGGKRRRPKMR